MPRNAPCPAKGYLNSRGSVKLRLNIARSFWMRGDSGKGSAGVVRFNSAIMRRSASVTSASVYRLTATQT